VHRDTWPCIVTRDLHRDTWPCIVTRDRASWHVTVHRDMWPCIVTRDRASWQILIIKPTRCTNSQIYFGNETLHVSESSSVHHQELFTVNSAMVYVIQVCRQLYSRIRMEHLDPAIIRSNFSFLMNIRPFYSLRFLQQKFRSNIYIYILHLCTRPLCTAVTVL
jgi:hypothetical protein